MGPPYFVYAYNLIREEVDQGFMMLDALCGTEVYRSYRASPGSTDMQFCDMV